MQRRRRRRKPNYWRQIRGGILALVIICSLTFLSQTAFAQNTYVITDGAQVKTLVSSETDPATVLNEAGVTLGDDDTYTTVISDGVYEITVKRSQALTVVLDGQELQVESFGETVGQLLARLNIPVTGDTRVSLDTDAQTYDGLVVTVSQPVRLVENYIAEIPYEVTYYNDPSLPAGVEAVLTEGRNGQMACTASVVYEEGQEMSRTILRQTVTEQPVNKVIAVGTGKPQDVAAQGGLIIGDGIIITEDGEVLTFTHTLVVEATAYTHTDEGCDFWTATGTHVRIGTVAVDPDLIPYGTRMFIVSNDGEYVYGISTAEDCGGAIIDKRIDLYYPTTYECFQFGRRDATIFFLG